MKYFHCVIPSNADHPEGKFVTETYIAADSKASAKVKASRWLHEMDGANGMFYKAPRFTEIAEETYIAKTEKQENLFDSSGLDQYLACLVIFGEQEGYDEAELSDADDLLANPADDEDSYAAFEQLRREVHDNLPMLDMDATLEKRKALALSLYNLEKPSGAVVDSASDASLSTKTVDNSLVTGADGEAESAPAPDEACVVKNHTYLDTRSQECNPAVNGRDWPDVELDIVLALTESVGKPAAVDEDVLTWARRKAERCPEDMLVWVLALRKVAGILDYGRDFVFDVVRECPDAVVKERDPAALDAYVAGFVRQFGMMYAKHPQYFAAPPAPATRTSAPAETGAAGTGQSDPDAPGAVDNWVELESEAEAELVTQAADTGGDTPPDTPAILAAFPPVNGLVESGAELVFDDLNARLAEIPPGHSLILTDLANETYHAADGYSSTTLRDALSGGMAKVQWRRQAPRKTEDSPALSLGTAVHTALLEPERFAAEYACAPQVNLRTNDGKEQMAAFEAECEDSGKVALKADDYATVTLMRDSALAYPTVAELLANGAAELSIFYRTTAGMLLKVRPDWLGNFGGALFILDLKTTDDVLDFGKSVEKFGYHIQAAFYQHVIQQALGLQADFAFCAIGKRIECGRYPVQLGILDDEDSQEGALQMQDALAVIAAGNDAGVALISRPWWAKQADRKRREAEAFAGGAA